MGIRRLDPGEVFECRYHSKGGCKNGVIQDKWVRDEICWKFLSEDAKFEYEFDFIRDKIRFHIFNPNGVRSIMRGLDNKISDWILSKRRWEYFGKDRDYFSEKADIMARSILKKKFVIPWDLFLLKTMHESRIAIASKFIKGYIERED